MPLATTAPESMVVHVPVGAGPNLDAASKSARPSRLRRAMSEHSAG